MQSGRVRGRSKRPKNDFMCQAIANGTHIIHALRYGTLIPNSHRSNPAVVYVNKFTVSLQKHVCGATLKHCNVAKAKFIQALVTSATSLWEKNGAQMGCLFVLAYIFGECSQLVSF
jgi:hypothetical protein